VPPTPASLSHEYWKLMSLGAEEYESGHWLEARTLFLRAHRLMPNARSLRGLGMTAFNLANYPQAWRELQAALADARRPLSGNLRLQTKELLERADIFVGEYRLLLSPEQALVRVDGLEGVRESDGRLLLAVGQRELEVSAAGYATLIRPLVVDGSDGETLRLQLEPLSKTRSPDLRVPSQPDDVLSIPSKQPLAYPTRPWTRRVFKDRRWIWVSGAGALLLGSTAGVLQLRAVEEDLRLERECARGCFPEDGVTDKRDRLEGWSRGLLTCSVLLTVTALVLFLRDELGERER
jgi:hypothetical protein